MTAPHIHHGMVAVLRCVALIEKAAPPVMELMRREGGIDGVALRELPRNMTVGAEFPATENAEGTGTDFLVVRPSWTAEHTRVLVRGWVREYSGSTRSVRAEVTDHGVVHAVSTPMWALPYMEALKFAAFEHAATAAYLAHTAMVSVEQFAEDVSTVRDANLLDEPELFDTLFPDPPYYRNIFEALRLQREADSAPPATFAPLF